MPIDHPTATATATARFVEPVVELLAMLLVGMGLAGCVSGRESAPSSSPGLQSSTGVRSGTGSPGNTTGFWPDGKVAAVSLTYDDALASQRLNALSQLGRHHLSATFFLVGKSDDLRANREDWAAVTGMGHELAAHTMQHPCDRSFDWVQKGFALQDYDLARMSAELEENQAFLRGLGAPPPYSFAYPCGATEVGEVPQAYDGLVAENFIAARGVQPELAQPVRVDLNRVPAIDGAKPKAQLLALVDRAEAEGAWLVFYFHGVGGDYLAVELESHEALLEVLEARTRRVWTAQFGRVASYVRERRQQ